MPFIADLQAADRIKDVLGRVSLQDKINTLQTSHEKGIPGSGVPASPGYVVMPKYTMETYSTSECLHGYCSGANMTVFPQVRVGELRGRAALGSRPTHGRL